MMKKFTLVMTVILLFVSLATMSCVGTSEVVPLGENMFPRVSGMDLQGNTRQFPDCLEKEKTIVIVAFKRWQQQWVDEWYSKISTLVKKNNTLAYFEVPTISTLTGPVRWWIYRGMRGGIQDEYMRSQVVTLHIDKIFFKKQLGIRNEDIIHIYVLDRKGHILTSQKGRLNLAKWNSVVKGLTL